MAVRRFVGKNVVITAGAKAIGLATALRLMAEGARVLITDRDTGALADAEKTAQAAGFELLTEAFDLSDPAACAAGVGRAIERLGDVHVLVNNAGGSLATPYRFADESDEDWARVMDLNVMAGVRVLREILPLMVRQRYGRIVMLGSKAGRYSSLIAGPNYVASKGAISALGRQIAMEYGPHQITCNVVCPGIVLTERTTGLWAERRSAEERERVLQEIPLRRHAVAEDIANVIAFFASDDASFITGTVQDVNGGQAMSG